MPTGNTNDDDVQVYGRSSLKGLRHYRLGGFTRTHQRRRAGLRHANAIINQRRQDFARSLRVGWQLTVFRRCLDLAGTPDDTSDDNQFPINANAVTDMAEVGSFGDYMGLAFVNGQLHPVWADNSDTRRRRYRRFRSTPNTT